MSKPTSSIPSYNKKIKTFFNERGLSVIKTVTGCGWVGERRNGKREGEDARTERWMY